MAGLENIDDILRELQSLNDRLSRTPDPLPHHYPPSVKTTLSAGIRTPAQTAITSYVEAVPTSAILSVPSVRRIVAGQREHVLLSFQNLEQALDLYSSVGDTHGCGIAHGTLSVLYMFTGNVQESLGSLSVAMAEFTATNDTRNTMRCGLNLGVIQAALPHHLAMMRVLTEVISLFPVLEKLADTRHWIEVEEVFNSLRQSERVLSEFAAAMSLVRR